jgi:hypothetical protein
MNRIIIVNAYCTKNYFKCLMQIGFLSSHKHYEVITIVPILEMKQVRPKEASNLSKPYR